MRSPSAGPVPSVLAILALAFGLIGCSGGQPQAPADDDLQGQPGAADSVRFRPLHIALEVTGQPVAAYQVELTVISGHASIVGVEGGDAPGFEDPPRYDTAALAGGRIILAAFNTTASLGQGRHRVATVHLREVGDESEYRLSLTATAAPDGSPAEATAILIPQTGETP